MEPSTPAASGRVATGDISSLTDAKARTLAQAWISAMNRIAHFSPETNSDDPVQRMMLSNGVSLFGIFGALVTMFQPWTRRRAMAKAARELGVSRKHTAELLRRFDHVWPGTGGMTYDEQVRTVAEALARG